jgi:hypothetical protein
LVPTAFVAKARAKYVVPVKRPVMVALKIPIPEPAATQVPDRVGFWFVEKHTPLAVTAAPPSPVTSPVTVAALSVIPDTDPVETVGRLSFSAVTKLTCAP